MEEQRILRRVETWPGRRPTQLAFEARGYSLHRAWQERVAGFCGEGQSDILNQYWDDVALETMQSLGRGDPDTRKFVIQPRYRSRLLDGLFLERVVEEPFRAPPLVPCLFERYKKIYFDAAFREGETAFFRSLHERERERLGIKPTNWSGRKRDFVPFADEFCTALGFTRRRNQWLKTIADFDDDALIFEVGVDTGGNAFCIGPPIIFKIYCENDPKFAFEITNLETLDRLVPGVIEYKRVFESDDLLLGGKALIELFDVIAESLND
ncbi:hypothetical protein XH98_11940 [Bradyrhizobium sp. CCBAU 51745]|uniref:hypothetical protein n=1 Tax=Bradyrhizobium sp. CCBAU 51745 TaxID=1325099 RepID=UPI0023063913|nr:hypothetical protein [Bradyrhizobium sp. CCBAU 51745]MDA9439827.1 hypothetical protein [Bradyrhizobium sp. CCBAU 51745]